MSDSRLTKTPRVDALIDRMMERYPGVSNDAQIRYYENVHQELAPLSRDLEIELAAMTIERDEWKAKAEANERDARRYQWLRDEWWLNDDPEDLQPDLNMVHAETAEQFDASIDAARNAEKEKE